MCDTLPRSSHILILSVTMLSRGGLMPLVISMGWTLCQDYISQGAIWPEASRKLYFPSPSLREKGCFCWNFPPIFREAQLNIYSQKHNEKKNVPGSSLLACFSVWGYRRCFIQSTTAWFCQQTLGK